MRKIIAAILALTLALGACFMLSSCGGKTDDPTTTRLPTIPNPLKIPQLRAKP